MQPAPQRLGHAFLLDQRTGVVARAHAPGVAVFHHAAADVHVLDDQHAQRAAAGIGGPGTHLASLFPGLARASTNSIHHQGIKDLAPGFVVEARCPEDGVVEAVRRPGEGFVAGVQWHPEFHEPGHPQTLDDRPILQDFLAAARAARG